MGDILLSQLRAFDWVCGRGVSRNIECTTSTTPAAGPITASKLPLVPLGWLFSFVVLVSIGACLYVRLFTADPSEKWFNKMKDQRRGMLEGSESADGSDAEE